MHCIQGSDAHSLETEQSDSANKRLGVGARVTEILVKEVSFNALKEILTGNDFTRTRPYRGASPWDFADRARAEGPEGPRDISTELLDGLQPGAYVLVAYGSAIREIEADEAAEILEVFTALQ